MSKIDYSNWSTKELNAVQQSVMLSTPGADLHDLASNPVYKGLAAEIKRRKAEFFSGAYKESGKTLKDNIDELFNKPVQAMAKDAKDNVKVTLSKQTIDLIINRVSDFDSTARNTFILEVADEVGLGDEQSKDLIKKLDEAVKLTGDSNLRMKDAAIKVALYHHLLSEEERAEGVAEVLSAYVLLHDQIGTKDLRERVVKISSSVIDMKNSHEVKALEDASVRIVDAFTDKDAKMNFGERVGKIWRSFVDKLPSIREASKMRDSIKDYTTGKAPTMKHQTPPKKPNQGKGRAI